MPARYTSLTRMPSTALARLARIEFAPPRYLALPAAGIDVSASGVKLAIITERMHGLELVAYGEEKLPLNALTGGEITDRASVEGAIISLARKHHVRFANIALPESRSYLFEANVPGRNRAQWRTAIEQRIDEYVPLPSSDVAFDVVPVKTVGSETRVVGIGYASRVVEESLSVFDAAKVEAHSVESEIFATPRALVPFGDTETVLIIDIGRTTTKIIIATGRIPRFATTVDIGGHALTLAVQKRFGITEDEARRVKAERGLVAGGDDDAHRESMLSTVSVIREEILRRLDYWQTRVTPGGNRERVTRAILVGGNASVRGLSEYLETGLKVPVEQGNVFTNLASPDVWLPELDHLESLAYATAIGLALRNYDY